MTSAQRCSVIPDPNRPSGVEENNYLFEKSQASSDDNAIILAIRHWWSQIRVTGGIGQGVTYTQYNVGKPTVWFIRMAWATTASFGCAVATCDSYWSVVCHYPGNMQLNEHLYMKGTPCADCPVGTFCNPAKLCQNRSTIV
ncbi:hypothetical protein OSTOST_08196 [Ostertagia ostertagi]